MSSLIILLAQTIGIAIMEILLMLAGAATIGYVTAWLFYKSVYNKKLKTIDTELNESKSQVLKLNAENSNLNKKLVKWQKKTSKQSNCLKINMLS